jgi:hypothetical protein
MVLIIAAALAFAFLPAGATVHSAPHTPVRGARGWEVLTINGNWGKSIVVFDHLAHHEQLRQAITGGNSSCVTCQQLVESTTDAGGVCATCHHLNKPNDQATPCWGCHQDMVLPTSIFDHTLHQTTLGGNTACVECHVGEHMPHTAKACLECHETMSPQVGETTFNTMAPGYTDAMHGACTPCHEQEAEAQARPELARCPACHQLDENAVDLQMALRR